ncbi:MAG: single-stranded DNA-binding protein [Syntrophorhabdaceae bacterium]|nr:single-stranded DNA-binding protein [Syntrophorhabdaceae bacterium]
MNIMIVSGNLGSDPEPIYTDTGIHIVNFPLGVKAGKKSFWLHVSCFDRLAEIAEKYLHKGAKILAEGALSMDKWINDENQVRSSFKLIATRIEFIKTDGRGFDKENPDEVIISEEE